MNHKQAVKIACEALDEAAHKLAVNANLYERAHMTSGKFAWERKQKLLEAKAALTFDPLERCRPESDPTIIHCVCGEKGCQGKLFLYDSGLAFVMGGDFSMTSIVLPPEIVAAIFREAKAKAEGENEAA